MLTLDRIYQAAHILKGVARKTDLILSPNLAPDCELYLKAENLQLTGSFKVRGAYYSVFVFHYSPEKVAEIYITGIFLSFSASPQKANSNQTVGLFLGVSDE